MKESYYFPHDYHARHDPKLAALIKEHGMLGYGIYWDFIEILHEVGGKFEKFPKMYVGLSQELSTAEATLKQIISALINDFKLLKEDDTHIWSDRVLENLRVREQKKLQKVVAGRLGGILSGKKRSKTKQNEATLEANEPKERKGKERKEDIYSDPNPVRISLNYFYDCFKNVFKKDYVRDPGKDGSIFKHLIANVSLDEIKVIIDKFFKSDDEFIQKSGYTTGVFKSQFNKLRNVKEEGHFDKYLTKE